jgi:hypothetical protein
MKEPLEAMNAAARHPLVVVMTAAGFLWFLAALLLFVVLITRCGPTPKPPVRPTPIATTQTSANPVESPSAPTPTPEEPGKGFRQPPGVTA